MSDDSKWWHPNDFGDLLLLVAMVGIFVVLITHPDAGSCSLSIKDAGTTTTTTEVDLNE